MKKGGRKGVRVHEVRREREIAFLHQIHLPKYYKLTVLITSHNGEGAYVGIINEKVIPYIYLKLEKITQMHVCVMTH